MRSDVGSLSSAGWPPSPRGRDPDVGSLQPGEAALRLVRQLAGGREGLPGPPALPAPAGVGHRLPHHVQLLARGECPPGPGAWAGAQAHRRLVLSPPEGALLKGGACSRGFAGGSVVKSWPAKQETQEM